MISKELFKKLEWKSIQIYFEDRPSFSIPLTYYRMLRECIRPITDIRGIEVYYYGYYHKEDGSDHHINLRFGCEESNWNKIRTQIIKILDEKKDEINLLDPARPYSDPNNWFCDIEGDKNRFAQISENNYDYSAYYWYVMTFYSFSSYFLEIIKYGDPINRRPGFEFLGILHLQWNLLGSIVAHEKNGIVYQVVEGIRPL